MSAWRLMAQELHREGGRMPYERLKWCSRDLNRLCELGLAEIVGKPSRIEAWQLTKLGIDYCEGRVKPHGRRGGIRFHATWLASLPRVQ